MFCTNCGKEIKEGSKFCIECGAAVTDNLQETVTERLNTREELKEQYEELVTEVEKKRVEYELLNNETLEAEKVKLGLAILHEEIEEVLKNARVSSPAENVVVSPRDLVQQSGNGNVQKKFCPKCGTRVDQARFCGKCGYKLF